MMRRFWVWIACVLLLGGASCSDDRRIEKVTVPAGSSYIVSLEDRLSTGWSQAGDPFAASTLEPIRVNGVLVMRAGAKVQGTLLKVHPAGSAGTGVGARLTIAFDTIRDPRGPVYLVQSKTITLIGEADPTHEPHKGRISGGISGAVVGDLSGAEGEGVLDSGGKAGIVLATSGRDIELAPGQKLRMVLVEPIVMPAIADMGRVERARP